MSTEQNVRLYIATEQKVEFFISTKADLLSEKVNTWLNEMQNSDQWFEILDIEPMMSYTSIRNKDKESGAYMIGCMVRYEIGEVQGEEIDESNDNTDNNSNSSDDFGLKFPS